MPLPSWVYEQTLRNQRQPLAQPRIPPLPQVGMPGPMIGPGNNPGMPVRGFAPVSPQLPTNSQGQGVIPTPQQTQPAAPVNTGMFNNYVPPTMQPQQTPQYVAPQFEDDSNIFANLNTGGNPLSGDYARIMAQLQGRMSQSGVKFNPFTPKEQTYSQSPELTNAIQMIRQLAESGGYSEEDKNNIRARGISPIRSVYANAMQDIDRNKSLQGGYSPNHNAAIAKLTREVADKVAGQTTNVNADLAEKVAQGKMAMAPQLGNITTHMNDLINQISGQNTAATNQAGMFNTTGQFNADTTNQGNQNQLLGMIQQLFGQGSQNVNQAADRAVNVAGMQQRGVQDRNQNRLATSTAQNSFNRSGQELSQQMQQFLQRMGLDTAQFNQQGNQANNANNFNWAQLNQQGGLGLIQAIMQMMGQQGRA